MSEVDTSENAEKPTPQAQKRFRVRLREDLVYTVDVVAAAWRIALIVALAIAGVVGIGALLSRFILAQVRPLLDTNRALGAGQLSARAPVLGNDEAEASVPGEVE